MCGAPRPFKHLSLIFKRVRPDELTENPVFQELRLKQLKATFQEAAYASKHSNPSSVEIGRLFGPVVGSQQNTPEKRPRTHFEGVFQTESS
jgi:hypothetical protein